MAKPCLIFCTAPPAAVQRAMDRELPPGATRLCAGPAQSPFARMAGQRFISWGRGAFTLAAALRLLPEILMLRPRLTLLPLNNLDGRGYLLLRLFARAISPAAVTEINIGGQTQTLTWERLAGIYRLEEKFHAAALRLLAAATPLFRLWLNPEPMTKRAAKPLAYRILSDSTPAAETPAASIIIRAYNEARRIGATLEMIRRQEGATCEIIVIDSGSTDGTLDIASRHPARIVSIRKEDFHYGAALNLGVRLARGRHIVNLSAHAVPADTGWLRHLLAPLSGPGVAGAHGRELPDDSACSPFERKILEDSFREQRLERSGDPFFSNANAAMPRALLLHNPFDESVNWAEDQLWAHRMQQMGYKTVYEPLAAVYHSHGLSLRQNFQRCRKFYQMLFQHIYADDPRAARGAFRASLTARALSLRRFLSERGFMSVPAALLYAPLCEHVNYLGCEFSWRDLRARAGAGEHGAAPALPALSIAAGADLPRKADTTG